MLPPTNASLRQPTLYARRRPPARAAVFPLEKARSSSLSWEARAKAQRIVTSSSSVKVGATVPPKSGCVRYWKACGRVSQLRPNIERQLRASHQGGIMKLTGKKALITGGNSGYGGAAAPHRPA